MNWDFRAWWSATAISADLFSVLSAEGDAEMIVEKVTYDADSIYGVYLLYACRSALWIFMTQFLESLMIGD